MSETKHYTGSRGNFRLKTKPAKSEQQADSIMPEIEDLEAQNWEANQQMLIDELSKEDAKKAKKSEKNKKRKDALKKKGQSKDTSQGESKGEVDSSSDSEVEEVVPKSAEVVTPVVSVQSPPKKTSACLADELEQVEIDVCIQNDAVTALQQEIADVLAELEAARAETEEFHAKRQVTQARISEKKRVKEGLLEQQRKDQITAEEAARQVEQLRREVDKLEHQRIRQRQDFERGMNAALQSTQEELRIAELKVRQTVADRARISDLSDENKRAKAATDALENERSKLNGILKMIGLTDKHIDAAASAAALATASAAPVVSLASAGAALLPELSQSEFQRIFEQKEKAAEMEMRNLQELCDDQTVKMQHKIEAARNDSIRVLLDPSEPIPKDSIHIIKLVMEAAARKQH